ncbi:hypothetical protein DVQ41_15615 [Yersinia enterocolitica]|nr:hypothetical protein [Yersinia enterocolitica]QBP98924.1 hypothetical protein YEY1_09125 [Yersinia enterocolitica subsp. palearctica]EKN5960218.1 hypothetical protein [Yersinia enterocolitica]EKN5967595.1 hypothetical protein [Yersinia enterocolitica]EKN5972083.1 hypothetical protein [Yersinia enterocolitica]
MCVGCLRSPQSLTCVSSWRFTQLSPSCNSNYLGYSWIALLLITTEYCSGRNKHASPDICHAEFICAAP